MAFPQVATSSSGQESSASTSHVVTLPSGVGAGNLLLIFIATDVDDALTPPSGWTELSDLSVSSSAQCGVAYRIADGSEGASATYTSSASNIAVWIAYRLTGNHASTAPEVAQGVNDSGANPNPPSLNPSNWGTEDTLWFAMAATPVNITVSSYPTNYTGGLNSATSAENGASVSVARRELNAASEDPGTFTLSTSSDHRAITLAVRPTDVVSSPLVMVI